MNIKNSSIRIALIVEAPRELSLTAGLCEMAPAAPAPAPDPPFMKIGRAQGAELHLSGPLIGDPRRPETALQISWYFPDEEPAEAARPVELSEAASTVTIVPRRRAEEGWRWRYRLESSRPFRQTLFFDGGFQPPFRPQNVGLAIEHLINYNYDGCLLARITYNHRAPAYIEADWRLPQLEDEGFLDD